MATTEPQTTDIRQIVSQDLSQAQGDAGYFEGRRILYGWAYYLRPAEPSEYDQLKARLYKADGTKRSLRAKDTKEIEERIGMIEAEEMVEVEDRVVRGPGDANARMDYERKGFIYLGPAEQPQAKGSPIPLPKPTTEQALEMARKRYAHLTQELSGGESTPGHRQSKGRNK